jgi:hypothetical protein
MRLCLVACASMALHDRVISLVLEGPVRSARGQWRAEYAYLLDAVALARRVYLGTLRGRADGGPGQKGDEASGSPMLGPTRSQPPCLGVAIDETMPNEALQMAGGSARSGLGALWRHGREGRAQQWRWISQRSGHRSYPV